MLELSQRIVVRRYGDITSNKSVHYWRLQAKEGTIASLNQEGVIGAHCTMLSSQRDTTT